MTFSRFWPGVEKWRESVDAGDWTFPGEWSQPISSAAVITGGKRGGGTGYKTHFNHLQSPEDDSLDLLFLAFHYPDLEI